MRARWRRISSAVRSRLVAWLWNCPAHGWWMSTRALAHFLRRFGFQVADGGDIALRERVHHVGGKARIGAAERQAERRTVDGGADTQSLVKFCSNCAADIARAVVLLRPGPLHQGMIRQAQRIDYPPDHAFRLDDFDLGRQILLRALLGVYGLPTDGVDGADVHVQFGAGFIDFIYQKASCNCR